MKIAVWSTLLEQYRRLDGFCSLGSTSCNNIDAFASGFFFSNRRNTTKKCLWRPGFTWRIIKRALRGKIRALRGIVILNSLPHKRTYQEFHFTRNNFPKNWRYRYEQSRVNQNLICATLLQYSCKTFASDVQSSSNNVLRIHNAILDWGTPLRQPNFNFIL